MKKISQQINKQWVSIAEAAHYLGVSQDTLRRWEKKGTLIPRRTVGGHRRYSRKQLERVLRQPMTPFVDQTTSYNKKIPRISIPPQSATMPAIKRSYQSQSKLYNIFSNISLYTKSWVFTFAIAVFIVTLLVASYILLQISKTQSQEEPISPVPTYRTIQIP